MKVAIAGSSGQIGTALAARLSSGGHEVKRLVRGTAGTPGKDWDPGQHWMSGTALEGVDAVVNLCGASIGDGRWNEKRKELLRSSRLDPTRTLVETMAGLDGGPKRLINASAVGYFGDRDDEELTEDSSRGEGFLADLVADWEAAALEGADRGLEVTCARFGVVLSKDGGALGKMLLPFKLGLGGPLGNGRQWFSWVTLDDATRALTHLLAGGEQAVNVVSPGAVTNREFTKALGSALRRPAFIPIPRFGMRLLFGESADELLFASQRVRPMRLLAGGFEFEHPDIASGLAAALERAAPAEDHDEGSGE
ncbi:MAG: TIGR01777 family oxidoreductase [Dehalococcoidia bacterium]